MKSRSAIRSYFAIVSILSIWWAAIAAGILLYNIGSKLIITDQEYLVWGSRSYELSMCDQPEYKLDKQVERTSENKELCKKDATTKILAGRNYDYKTGIIMWVVWLAVCLIVYGFHYPRLKAMKEEMESR